MGATERSSVMNTQVIICENNIAGVPVKDITLAGGLHVEYLPADVPLPRIGEQFFVNFPEDPPMGGTVEKITHHVLHGDLGITRESTVWVRSLD